MFDTTAFTATETPAKKLEMDTTERRKGIIVRSDPDSVGTVYCGWGQSTEVAFSVTPGDEKSVETPASIRSFWMWCAAGETALGTFSEI